MTRRLAVMEFITYWKLREDLPMDERIEAAAELVESGAFPPDDVTVLRWDITPDMWGILVTEAETAEQITRALGIWRAVAPGFFEQTVTGPAMPVEASIEQTMELLESMPAAD